MKCAMTWALSCLALCVGLLMPGPAHAGKPSLHFFTWVEYIDPEVVKDFSRRHNVEIRFSYFNSDSERDQRLTETSGRGYDLVMLNGPVIETYRKLGWLEPLDEARMPQLRNASARWRDAYPAARKYSIPYMLGTLGVAYRSDLVPGGIDSWLDVFQPTKALCGRIYMGGDSRELINIALKASGARADSTDPADYKRAEALLLKQKPCVAAYEYPTTGKSVLSDGRAVAAMAFSSDMATLQETDPRVRYVVPREGGGLWADFIVVLATSSNKKLAMAFLDYLHTPAVHARLTEYTGAMPTNPAAEKLLPPEVRANRTAFPDPQVLARSEEDKGSPPEITRLRNTIFSKVVR